MYPVSANFHTLAIQDAPKTRVRIYFIGDAVDCTDDNAVQTNGTLLIGKAGDTDSNGRIGQNGITFSEFFNPDKNIQVGAAVSSQVGMTLLNTDGALDNFQYGRCKVYLDVYDTANSSWLTCPMGVYIINLPTKRKVQLVNATGYDQMQKLDEICDTWWSALNWSGGITMSQLLTSLATQIGVSVSSNTASAIVNGSVSFTEEPFQCVEVTYREVLEYIAEATGTVARFDRNGALDLRWFDAAQISGNTVTINTDTVGNQCLAISVAEYSVAAVDLLKVKLYTDDIGTTVGSGTNQYTIVNNLFLDGANSAAIIAKATPIYNRLHGLGAYSPVSARIIMDWSIEAGDIINIVNGGTTYSVPIFQQSMAWRGGYVVSDLISDGDNVRPVLDYDERTYYRLNSEMSKKVGDNEIISKINQSPESITIQANKVNLTGYITATNLATPGQTVINGGNITTGSISADRIAGGTLTVGGLNNASGQILIKDSNNDVVGSIDNDCYMLINPSDNSTAARFGMYQNDHAYIDLYDSVDGRTVDLDGGNGSLTLFGNNGSVAAYGHNGTIILNDGTYDRVKMYGNNGTVLLQDANNVNQVLLSPASSGSLFLVPLNTYGGLFANNGLTADNATVNGLTAINATVNGVLDVTPRRCEATLSAAGWYRAIVYNAYDTNSAQGESGEIVTIRIVYTSSVSVQHEISLFMTKGKVAFLNETSHGTTNLVDKIRYTYAGAVGYVDIHTTSLSSVTYNVSFEVASRTYAQGRWVAGTLTSVASSPSGETVLTEHTFTTDGVRYQTFTAYGKTWTFRKYGNVVYVDAPDAMTPTTSGGNSIGTLPSEFRPSYTTRLVAANAEGAYKVLLINTDGSVSAFCYTTVGQSTPYSITGSYLAI